MNCVKIHKCHKGPLGVEVISFSLQNKNCALYFVTLFVNCYSMPHALTVIIIIINNNNAA